MRMILASGSPRRADLLKQMGLTFDILPSQVKEGQPYEPKTTWVQELARSKALSIPIKKDDVVIGADTVVVLQDKVLGKPKNDMEAMEMLKCLSGKGHKVITGICVVHKYDEDPTAIKVYQDVEITQVIFRDLSTKELEHYIASGEPMDKAGAYGIQGLGGLLVERIEGCYYNVVGLPLVKTMNLLRQCKIPVLGYY